MWDPFRPMLYSMLIMITLLLLANYALGSETKSQWLNDNPCMITTETTTVEKDGVTIVGIPMLCQTIPNTASMLYSNNVTNFVTVLVEDGKLGINQEEQVLTGDEGGISAGYGGILIAEGGKIHENHTKLMEAMK